MENDRRSYTGIFVALAMIFVPCLVVSNLIAGKLWEIIPGIAVPASAILFPVTYILSDVFTEVYGFERTRLVIWLGFLCNFIAVVAYVITILLPYPKYWYEQEAFAVVLGMTPRFLIASLAAYLLGEFSNSITLSKLKVKNKGEHLWSRLIISTVIGEALDSVIFILIAFVGVLPARQLFMMIIFQYVIKLIFEVVCSPLTIRFIGYIKKKDEIDTYDYEQKYKFF